MYQRATFLAMLFAALGAVAFAGQAYAPIVAMSVTLPDGQKQELAAPESGLARVTLKDGTQYAFRPTMEDDKGSTTVVTIFKMTPSIQELGEVDVKLGAAAVTSKTTPAFKIAVLRVSKSST